MMDAPLPSRNTELTKTGGCSEWLGSCRQGLPSVLQLGVSMYNAKSLKLTTLVLAGLVFCSWTMAQPSILSFPPLAALAPEHLKLIPTKPLHALSVYEMSTYKQLWKGTGPGDEPPYPIEGTAEVLNLALERARQLDAQEDLIVVAEVNESGQVTSVTPRRYSDDQLLKSVKWLLVDTVFKPARCNGTPCKSSFPLIVRAR